MEKKDTKQERAKDDSCATDFFLGITRADSSSSIRSRSQSVISRKMGPTLGDSCVDLSVGVARHSPRVEYPKIGDINYRSPSESDDDDIRPIDEELEEIHNTIANNITLFVSSELQQWKNSHKKELESLESQMVRVDTRMVKVEKELTRLDQRTSLLSNRIDHIKSENETLRETITQLENILSNGPDITVTALTNIREKLWEGFLQIDPEKKRHINLLKKLTLTRFNRANEKHAALLQKFLQLHQNFQAETSIEEQWKLLGFPSNDGTELDTTGILGLQNLVYFSERNSQLARAMYSRDSMHFPSVGISITALLITMLNLYSHDSSGAALPANDITKTFVRLMDHPKAFEELYCVCFRLYDKAVQSGDPEPLRAVDQQIRALLQSSPTDLQQLVIQADNL